MEQSIQCGMGIYSIAKEWKRDHPYRFSFIIALIFVSYLLFYTPSFEFSEEDIVLDEQLQFVDIRQVEARAPKRVVKKQVATQEDDVSETSSNVDRAMGASDDANAVDMAFYPSIAPPKPIGKLKKRYPKIAKKMGIEAVINVELLIASNGKVRNVDILGVRLTKALPTELHMKISALFAKDALKILLGARFSPPIVNGKRTPIKMEMPLKFRLK